MTTCRAAFLALSPTIEPSSITDHLPEPKGPAVPPDAYCQRMHRKGRPLHNQFRTGFTLLELLVVIVILGLLAAYIGPKYFSQLGKAEVTAAKAQIEAFEKALDTFRLDVGRYPTTEEGLNSLLVKPASAERWNGPYLKKAVPPDPWGKPYVYRFPGTRGEYDIASHGRDGQPGGSAEDADISN